MALHNEHIPTDEQRQAVLTLVSEGVPLYEVAKRIGCACRTLTKHYASEIDEGESIANARIKQTAYQLATSGECPAMTIFLCKTRLGWRETTHHEHSGIGGNALEIVIRYVDGDDQPSTPTPGSTNDQE